MSARLAAHVEVSALIRRAEALGGHAAVIRRGEREAGTILILVAERGVAVGILERVPTLDDRRRWLFRSTREIDEKQPVNHLLERRAAIDPDLWMIELDIPQAERFTAEMIREG